MDNHHRAITEASSSLIQNLQCPKTSAAGSRPQQTAGTNAQNCAASLASICPTMLPRTDMEQWTTTSNAVGCPDRVGSYTGRVLAGTASESEHETNAILVDYATCPQIYFRV